MSRSLLLQLARLGDLIQSLPVIHSLRTDFPERQLDLLCAAPLVSLGRFFSGIDRVYPWDGERWRSFSTLAGKDEKDLVEAAEHYLTDFAFDSYPLAYNLNNHPRSILAAHLFGERVIGSGDLGPLNSSRPPWVDYLHQVACERGDNRIHLADAFCGICGVMPPALTPILEPPDLELPGDITQIINDSSLIKIGIVLGAGDADRRVPVATWKRLIEGCAEHLPNSVCVLIGGAGEREIGMAVENQLSTIYLSRILNCVGRTTLPQLANVLHRCQWVVGSDTGPLHLGVACGARAIGWYFSRARVHETGPYGVGHYVWQYRGTPSTASINGAYDKEYLHVPSTWPVLETLELMQDQDGGTGLLEWELWNSKRDKWGMFYTSGEASEVGITQREEAWSQLSHCLSNHQVVSNSHAKIAG